MRRRADACTGIEQKGCVRQGVRTTYSLPVSILFAHSPISETIPLALLLELRVVWLNAAALRVV